MSFDVALHLLPNMPQISGIRFPDEKPGFSYRLSDRV
jgi:hypothetical protein